MAFASRLMEHTLCGRARMEEEQRDERYGKQTCCAWSRPHVKKLLIRGTFSDRHGRSVFTHSSTGMHLHGRERETPQCSSISLSERNIWRASVKSPNQRRGIYLHLQIAHNMPRATGNYSAMYSRIHLDSLGIRAMFSLLFCFKLGFFFSSFFFTAAQRIWKRTKTKPLKWWLSLVIWGRLHRYQLWRITDIDIDNCDEIKTTHSVVIIILTKRSTSYQIFRIHSLENRHAALSDEPLYCP